MALGYCLLLGHVLVLLACSQHCARGVCECYGPIFCRLCGKMAGNSTAELGWLPWVVLNHGAVQSCCVGYLQSCGNCMETQAPYLGIVCETKELCQILSSAN